ncbi:MAG: hypothetical protein EPN48_01045 [Microbacteriaceae bacterium]|nr:MAG: hypothetical protein EPN48_01045 [Microbacteriaceae bacterium]
MLRAQRARERRRRILTWSISGAVIAAILAVITVTLVLNARPGSSASAATSTAIPATPAAVAIGASTAPPWAAPADPTARVKAAGLGMLTSEGTAQHIHSHLSVTVDGKAVQVPALLGIDEAAQTISPLHTHDTSGIIHIESPVKSTFTLGEVFTEWDVALDATHIGSLGGGDGQTVAVFVNGKKTSGDPAAITLAEHEDIDIVVTPTGTTAVAPAAFNWPSGY